MHAQEFLSSREILFHLGICVGDTEGKVEKIRE